jgi:hypothetical protein
MILTDMIENPDKELALWGRDSAAYAMALFDKMKDATKLAPILRFHVVATELYRSAIAAINMVAAKKRLLESQGVLNNHLINNLNLGLGNNFQSTNTSWDGSSSEGDGKPSPVGSDLQPGNTQFHDPQHLAEATLLASDWLPAFVSLSSLPRISPQSLID